ncbi:hypothetical protein C8R43DRAFT_1130346 [Mycena crocata]|nr:hypothetical protein C8R43DRAFT_1130346 [Mycena crocata]
MAIPTATLMGLLHLKKFRPIALFCVLAGIHQGATEGYARCYSGAKHPSRCLAQRDDYMECIHGTKELARKSEIEAEFLRQQARAAHERKQEGEGSVPTRVGLVPPAEGDDK